MSNNKDTVRHIQPDELLVSKTDLHGNITYCNSNLLAHSAYSMSELLGKEMFSIAHADVPQSIFRHIWSELKGPNNEVFGLIKSQSNDAHSYWSFLNATPSFSDANELIGFFFVERSATVDAISYFENLYRQMCSAESKSSASPSGLDDSFQMLKDAATGHGGHNEFVISHYA